MDIRFDPDNDRLELSFADNPSALAFLRNASAQKGFMLHLDAEPRQFQRLRTTLGSPETRVAFDIEVAQTFPGGNGRYGLACLLVDWDASKAEILERRFAHLSEAQKPEQKRPVSETRGASPAHRIQQMNPTQKSLLAIKAGRVERQILLKESSPQVLQALLANPRIESEDVLRLCRSNHTPSPLLQRIATDARWGKSQDILTAIVRNPKTPTNIAVRLIETLRTSDLRPMAKMGGLKEVLRKAALKEYLRRSGGR